MNEPYTSSPPLNRERSPLAASVDNIIRRRLRVGNPGDAREIAEGLLRLFPSAREALAREASGLPIVPKPTGPAAAAAPGPSGAELDQGLDDVERDLMALTNNSQLKDIEAELDGWAQAIRGIIADGTSAARLALDPRSRDRAFAARRQLGDYARMARLVGAMTPNLSPLYRRLAQSLDEVGGLLLVLLGESLASVGMSGGRFLLNAPASELQARRDAVLAALRTLVGSTQEAYGPSDWPYGLHALREVLLRLETSGHADLRALLEENTLARVLDDLLDRASVSNARGLRALGATAQVTVQRLQRLINVTNLAVDPESPPLASFLEAVQIFIDAFQGSTSGYRLLFIARPPLVFYGMYGIGGPDVATRRLIDVIVERGRLAQQLDCYLACDCCEEEAICQVLLDKLLYDVDRAIDLLTLGCDPNGAGEPEVRAAAYGQLIAAFLLQETGKSGSGCLDRGCTTEARGITRTLEATCELLLSSRTQVTAEQKEMMRDELCLQRQTDARWTNLVATMAPTCIPGSTVLTRIDELLASAIEDLGYADGEQCPLKTVRIPPTTETSIAGAAYTRLPTGEQPTSEQLKSVQRRFWSRV